MKNIRIVAVYWDASAALSVLFQDQYTKEALSWLNKNGFHFLSSLAYSEIYAVIARMKRENILNELFIKTALRTLQTEQWQQLNVQPSLKIIHDIAWKSSLRGADLWHLATAITLQKEIPELSMLTFDNKLKAAASTEGL